MRCVCASIRRTRIIEFLMFFALSSSTASCAPFSVSNVTHASPRPRWLRWHEKTSMAGNPVSLSIATPNGAKSSSICSANTVGFTPDTYTCPDIRDSSTDTLSRSKRISSLSLTKPISSSSESETKVLSAS
uniref:Secreted RxLR effector protein 68 n=1 Tax=Plasmopara viticola TaxID=143451 RepID=RLR68_PLAVT|nr:RecName: Full=Secreted RxLR effector protein 68; Flags: Precursor [Plasmopara viticola]ANC73388.1 secreted RxLR effector peptide protein 68 [Plasmopara viticola]